MKGVFYIENSTDEWHSGPSAYFETLKDAMDAMRYFADWFYPYGTGRIWYQPFGFDEKTYETFGGTVKAYGKMLEPEFICRGTGINEETGEVEFSKERF